MTDDQNACQIDTPIGVLSYPHLDKPDRYKNKGEPKFRCNLVIVADDERSASDKAKEALGPAIRLAATHQFGAPDLNGLHLCLKPASASDKEAFGDPDALTLRASSLVRPKLFDAQAHALDPDDPATYQNHFYAGAFVRLKVWVYGWEAPDRNGVSAILLGIQFDAHGERLGASGGAVTFEPLRAAPPTKNAFAPTPQQPAKPADGMPF